MALLQVKDVSGFLNIVRETSSDAYQTQVPLSTTNNIADVGQAVLGLAPALENEFIYAVNKIIKTIVESMSFSNPLKHLKKGKLEYGATVEHLFIDIIQSHPYVAGTREGDTDYPDPLEIFKVDNKSAFYHTQLEKQYAYTIHRNDLKRAFVSNSNFSDYINKLAQSLKTSEEWDDYRMTVALISKQIEKARLVDTWKGEVKLVTLFNASVPEGDQVTSATAMNSEKFLRFMVNQIQKYSRRLKFPRQEFNVAGVTNTTTEDSQRLMMLSDIVPDMNTNLYYDTINPSYLEIGGVDYIDTWYSVGVSSTGTSLPESVDTKSIVALSPPAITKAVAVLYDQNLVQIWNKVRESTQAFNPRGLYYNNFLTTGDIFACSPYANFVVFTLA